MPRGRLDKIGAENRLYKLMNRLDDEPCADNDKYLARRYLNYVLDYIKEHSNQKVINKPWANGSTTIASPRTKQTETCRVSYHPQVKL